MKISSSIEYRPLARRAVVIGLLGLTGLLGITVVDTSYREAAPARDDAVSAPAARWVTDAGRPRPFRYVRSGQWLADARTYTAMIRYLLDPELQISPSGVSPSLQLATPPNIVSTTPPLHGTS